VLTDAQKRRTTLRRSPRVLARRVNPKRGLGLARRSRYARAAISGTVEWERLQRFKQVQDYR